MLDVPHQLAFEILVLLLHLVGVDVFVFAFLSLSCDAIVQSHNLCQESLSFVVHFVVTFQLVLHRSEILHNVGLVIDYSLLVVLDDLCLVVFFKSLLVLLSFFVLALDLLVYLHQGLGVRRNV